MSYQDDAGKELLDDQEIEELEDAGVDIDDEKAVSDYFNDHQVEALAQVECEEYYAD